MSILNRPSDGLLSVLLALRRALIAYGPQTADRLIDLCAPPKSDALGKTDMARKTLTRWTQLGFFKDDEGVIKLAPAVKKIATDDLNALRSWLLRLVLLPENNPTLAAERDEEEDDKAEKSKAADFATAASWALAQDVYSFIHSYPAVEKLVSSQRITLKVFSNDTRWSGFVEWAPFLGLGIQTAKVGLVLNPFFAVWSVLNEVFEGASELPQDIFLFRLAQTLPVIEGGQYRQTVDAATGQPWHVLQAHQVSPCLSVALQTLVDMKVLRLESRSDALLRVLLGREGRERGYRFSHVIRLEAA